MASSSPREIIQVSLGPSANAITAHLLNLQGLAATSSSSEDIYCDPATTHYVQSSHSGGGGTLVPRVLMVDESTHHVPETLTAMEEGATKTTSPSDLNKTSLYEDSFWSGQIQILGDDALVLNNGVRSNGFSRKNSPFWNAASSMAYSSYSRYHRSRDSDYSGHKYQADPNNSRHVVWDDDEEEEDEEDRYERRRREEENEWRWKTQTSVAIGQELDRLIEEEFHNDLNGSMSESSVQSSSKGTKDFCLSHWTDILMPPYDNKAKVVLPFSSQSQLVPHWNVSYQCDGNNAGSTVPFLEEWKEETLFENLRHMLEGCDYGIQGISIATEGCGIYASLATFLLNEVKQECKSACRLIYHVTDEMKINEPGDDPKMREDIRCNGQANSPPTSISWQEAQVDRIRKQMSSGLALHDFAEKAHAILPLRLSGDSCDLTNGSCPQWFRATARVAVALEASTLPFRFSGKNENAGPGRSQSYQIGLQNAPFMSTHGSSDALWGSTAKRLTFSEYLQVLQPSSSYSMLELDVLSKTTDNYKLYNYIREGTSVERDQRMRESRGHTYHTRPRDNVPGTWMHDVRHGAAGRGLLSSLSYPDPESMSSLNLERSVHHHFALTTSVRPALSLPSDNNEGVTMSNYLTCLIQGMGIQYRPERSMATVLNQSLKRLTFGEGGGSSYGAGIYWKYVLPQAETPVVAVLGNTTRAFASLNKTASDMKAVMKTLRFRGYYNRDVSNGVLPEMEDCEEALESCFNKRDIYRPPSGSGFDVD
mmetsp:Transcript_13699/g.38555  ORF Transcript_13699/g.38555 Transcript_13699/m.38555 type:complete len:764 (-) Transcript_13699:2611-4902(-)